MTPGGRSVQLQALLQFICTKRKNQAAQDSEFNVTAINDNLSMFHKTYPNHILSTVCLKFHFSHYQKYFIPSTNLSCVFPHANYFSSVTYQGNLSIDFCLTYILDTSLFINYTYMTFSILFIILFKDLFSAMLNPSILLDILHFFSHKHAAKQSLFFLIVDIFCSVESGVQPQVNLLLMHLKSFLARWGNRELEK